MQFRIATIPISISPFFWLTAGIIGWFGLGLFPGQSPFIALLLWVGVVFLSVLVHELGHGLTALYFGKSSKIVLTPFGGITHSFGEGLKKWKEFLIVLFGPLFGFFLFFFAAFFLVLGMVKDSSLVYLTLRLVAIINFYWTVINLIPLLPLDGGQLIRIILEGIFREKGIKYAYFTSFILSMFLCLFSFFVGFFFGGILFSIFAVQNFGAWRQVQRISFGDCDQQLSAEFQNIQKDLSQGEEVKRPLEVISRLEKLRSKAKKGILFTLATEQLASFKAKKNDYKGVYDLLAPIEKELSERAQIDLHSAAYQLGDYPLVISLSGNCFRFLPDPLLALHTAEAYGATGKCAMAIRWLQTAREKGITNLQEVIGRSTFDPIRNETMFRSFIQSLRQG